MIKEKRLPAIIAALLLAVFARPLLSRAEEIKIRDVLPAKTFVYFQPALPIEHDDIIGPPNEKFPMTSGAFKFFAIPPAVPDTAREILIFAWFDKGWDAAPAAPNAAHDRGDGFWTIYTKEQDGTQYGQRIYMRAHRNDNTAVVNSANMWLPLTAERVIWVAYEGGDMRPADTNFLGKIEILGYR